MEKRRSALIVLYTGDGKILLQHRSPDAPRSPNLWGCFGGGIEGDETPEQAVRRECFEEIEYRLQNPVLIHEGPEHLFIEKYNPSKPIVLHEGQGYGWFTILEARALPLSEHLRTALGRLAPSIFN
ncbi:NUDIX domain-containing protein [Patescibacteria group bacterium]|nr:NUDIX domain-containing protein [Patescibacteria group bacterium]